MQDASSSTEITEIGYFGDLLMYGTSEGEAVEDRLDLNDLERAEETADQAKKLAAARQRISGQVVLSPQVVSRLRKSLGARYDMLSTESRVIAATAIEEFEQMGNRPHFDYAGISMKTAKLIERELTIRVFRPWRVATTKDIGRKRLSALSEGTEALPVDRTEQALLRWLLKR